MLIDKEQLESLYSATILLVDWYNDTDNKKPTFERIEGLCDLLYEIKKQQSLTDVK